MGSTGSSLVERRSASRRRVEGPLPVKLLDVSGQPMHEARLADISTTGVGLHMNRPLPPGREFALAVPNGAEIATPLRYRVVRCRPLGGGLFHIGAAFVRAAQQPTQ